MLRLVTREVKILTSQGKGGDFIHPYRVDYYNPISAIWADRVGDCYKFETQDGSVGQIPKNDIQQFVRYEIKDCNLGKL